MLGLVSSHLRQVCEKYVGRLDLRPTSISGSVSITSYCSVVKLCTSVQFVGFVHHSDVTLNQNMRSGK